MISGELTRQATEVIEKLTKENAELKSRISKASKKQWEETHVELAKAQAENAELRAKLEKQSNQIQCMYCNETYGIGDEDKLTDHILSCEKSPLVQMVKQMESRITDYMDMMNDEFTRITALTYDTEIVGICQRAMVVIAQNEPVIKQRDDAIARAEQAEALASQQGMELVAHRENAQGNYWAWQGDKDDHVESLSNACPVLIHSAAFQDILKQLEQAEAKVKRLREAVNFYADPSSYKPALGEGMIPVIIDSGETASHAITATEDGK